MKNKLFKKLLTIGLPLAMAVCIFSGCASTGGGDSNTPPGTLTITGIPEEFNGKFISVGYSFFPDPSKKIGIAKKVAGINTAVKNGEARLPLHYIGGLGNKVGSGYIGNDTVDSITININDTSESKYFTSEPDFAFASSVTFKNGVAAVKWDDAFKVGISITINNIPAQYISTAKELYADVFIYVEPDTTAVLGKPLFLMGSYGHNRIENDNVTIKIYKENQGPYLPAVLNGTKSVMVGLPSGKIASTGTVTYDYFLFKAVQITDGNAVLDFRQGVKQ